MVNKILKILDQHTILDNDSKKVIKVDYPYKETLSMELDDLFCLYAVGKQSELLIAELVKAKALTEHLTPQERNEYFDLAISNL